MKTKKNVYAKCEFCECACECGEKYEYSQNLLPQLDEDGKQAYTCSICTEKHVDPEILMEFILKEWGHTKEEAIELYYQDKFNRRKKEQPSSLHKKRKLE